MGRPDFPDLWRSGCGKLTRLDHTVVANEQGNRFLPMLQSPDLKAKVPGKTGGRKLFTRLSFGLAIFTSAFLLFQVQLLLGKFLLPWFGGTSAVWATCLLFFQVLLLGGYLYAHRVSTRCRLPGQGKIHLAFLALGTLWILLAWYFWGSPLLPGPSWKPAPGTALVHSAAPAKLVFSSRARYSEEGPVFLLRVIKRGITHWAFELSAIS
jgi:hypothetical protein